VVRGPWSVVRCLLATDHEPRTTDNLGVYVRFDDQGLIPAIVQHARSGEVLMLGYMNEEALRRTIESGLVTFWSRSRQSIWQKGETSGNLLQLVELRQDCDGDTLLVL